MSVETLGPFLVTVLVLPGSSMMTVASVIDPWRALNRVTGAERAAWCVVTPDGKAVPMTCGLKLTPDGALGGDATGDMLAVVAGFDVLEHATKPVLGSLRRVLPRFGTFAGIESGAWVLGALGLLDGKRATAHWEDLEDFATTHSKTEVRPDRWVEDGRFLTAGGASPAFDLMLHLIRRHWGPSAALDVASVFVYDETRAASDPQPLVSMGKIEAREPRVARAIKAMEGALDRPLATEVLARRSGVSVRRLEQLFRDVLSTSPGAYYAGLRLLAARRLVTDTALPFSEVALRTGFGSASAFSRAFRRHAGMTALEARALARTARAAPGRAAVIQFS